MTRERLRSICKEHDLYRTPQLNDKLFCNLQGFTSIGDLDEYTELRALFLEGNALSDLAGLPRLIHLRCLCVGPHRVLCHKVRRSHAQSC